MPRKLGNVTKDILVNAPLPIATKTYTVISHQFVIDTIYQELANNGFSIKHELYKCTKEAQEAIGKFIVDYNSDPDLSMMYAFVNSYNKMIKFGATFGVYVHESESFMVGQLGDWNRKHTGTADFETQQKIEEQMADAKDYYDQLANDKAAMQKIEITRDRFGALLGTLFLRGWLTIDMVSLAAKEFDTPSYTYSTPKDNLWTCYNHILVALRQSNPRVWLANQSAIHLYMCLEFDLAQFDVDETTDGDVCQETGTTQEESNHMDNVIEQYTDILLPQDGVSECPPEDEEYVDDTPEITGIPNGNTMSDTDDEEYTEDELASLLYGVDNNNEVVHDLDAEEDEDWEKMGAVAIDPDGDEDHIDGVDELPNPDTTITTVEDVQSIPTDNVVEVNEDDYTYVAEEDYPDAVTGSIVDIDSQYYEVDHVTTMEGENYLALLPMDMSAVEDEHVGPPEMYTGDTIASTDIPFDMEESSEVIAEVPLQQSEAGKREVALKAVISNEISELYGYNPEFSFTKKDEYYDITLDSGESFVLQANYIDSMVNE